LEKLISPPRTSGTPPITHRLGGINWRRGEVGERDDILFIKKEFQKKKNIIRKDVDRRRGLKIRVGSSAENFAKPSREGWRLGGALSCSGSR